MSIVCEHTSYMGQNFTHSSNHEHGKSFFSVIVQNRKRLEKEKQKHELDGIEGICNLNKQKSFELL